MDSHNIEAETQADSVDISATEELNYRQKELAELFKNSNLGEHLKVNKTQDYPDKNYSALRFVSNSFRLRAIEIWEGNTRKPRFFRIYHAAEIPQALKLEIDEIPERLATGATYSDFQGDFKSLCVKLSTLLSSDIIVKAAEETKVFARGNAYEGLELGDVDTSDNEIMGRLFSWRDIIAISEDASSENLLRDTLSANGVYLQRSLDGASRYVGSAYGDGGILGRWMKHLTSNGHAKHLNIFVLEEGYSNMVFTVLETTDKANPKDARDAESRWKKTLGTLNLGPYDKLRLNNN